MKVIFYLLEPVKTPHNMNPIYNTLIYAILALLILGPLFLITRMIERNRYGFFPKQYWLYTIHIIWDQGQSWRSSSIMSRGIPSTDELFEDFMEQNKDTEVYDQLQASEQRNLIIYLLNEVSEKEYSQKLNIKS